MTECGYCGEKEGQIFIDNPNGSWDEDMKRWWVCLGCEGTIHWQQMHSMACVVNSDRLKKEAIENLDRIAEETGTPYMIAEIRKKPDKEEHE